LQYIFAEISRLFLQNICKYHKIYLREEGVVGLEYVCMKEREGGLDTPQGIDSIQV